jgi:hypothetical protein
MDKNIKSTIDTINTVVNVITDNLTTYTNKALNEIKNMEPEYESKIQPVLGYDTGDQGWYDMLGGGPCNNYCRYTGLSPNIKWNCSDEKDLSKLSHVSKNKTGRFCYGYDKQTLTPVKTGAVIKGTFISTEEPTNTIDDSGNYNFIIYNNKDANGIENFETVSNTQWKGPQKIDYPSNDIKIFSINKISDCGNQCYNTPNCVGFVTDDSSSMCWLKSNFGNPNIVSNRNTYTIDRNPQSTDSRWTGPEQLDYPGNDIQQLNVTNPTNCGEACLKNASCKGFITDDIANTCWLKSKLETSIPASNRNTYKMNASYDTVNNTSLKECENLCQNDDNCKGFNYDIAKKSCAISAETIKPIGFDTNSISGNKKVHMALNGTYNIYQNNSCVNSTLFNKDANVSTSLGIITDSNGTPIIPQQPICSNNMNNNFIFGKNYEIMALDADVLESNKTTEKCDFWDWGCHATTTPIYQNVNDARCLQVNPDSSVTKENCIYTDNQKWTYDKNINSIRTWDGNCLNVDTDGQNITVSAKPCVDNVNQQFYLKTVSENLQPLNYTVLDNFDNINKVENFATNTCVNDYLLSNRNNKDYLYKLPYSSPYIRDVDNTIENFEMTDSISTPLYLLYLIVLIMLFILLITKK